MSDLREYSFGDWFRLFLKAVPAMVLAVIVVVLPVIILLGLVWFLMGIGPR